jgi:hypothetical protein
VLALVAPDLGRMIELNTPFGIGTVERTLEDKSTETTEKDGTKVTTTDKIIERSVLDRWMYRYRIDETARETQGTSFVTTVRNSTWQQIDPVTGQDIDSVGVDDITLVVLMLYWILGDASRFQGTLGKRALGLRVVGEQGERLNLATAAGRNLLKILSAVLLLVGFMMAGWTRRKQALHDMITGSFVVAER